MENKLRNPSPRELPAGAFIHALNQVVGTDKPSLGDTEIVSGLLNAFLQKLLSTPHDSADEFSQDVENTSKILAPVFLGKSDKVEAPSWNSPGQIDEWLAQKLSIESEDPEERVAGALVRFAIEYMTLVAKIESEKLISEQWEPESRGILSRYTHLFLGAPVYGGATSVYKEGQDRPKHRLPMED